MKNSVEEKSSNKVTSESLVKKIKGGDTLSITDFKILRLRISGYDGLTRDEKKQSNQIWFDDVPDDITNAMNELYHNIPSINISVTMLDVENNQNVQLDIIDGLTVIYGPSNSGKTSLLNFLHKNCGGVKIQFHEPERESLMSPGSLIRSIEDFLFSSDKHLLLIDSLRFFVYNSDSKAAAVSGGISASLFTELTNLSLIASKLKKKIVVIVNFLSQSDKNLDVIANSLLGSTAAIMEMSNVLGSFRYSGRDAFSKRGFRTLSWSEKDNVDSDSGIQLSKLKEGEDINLPISLSIEDELFKMIKFK